jgi:hypothetical protein
VPSITGWFRIEPRVRGASLAGAQARVADPLWLLARQWQVGEFEGEDAASPIAVEVTASVARLSRWAPVRPGPQAQGGAYDPDAIPLEVLVEREPASVSGEVDVRLAAEAGLAFLRALDTAGGDTQLRAAALTAYPLAPLTGAARAAAGAAGCALADVMAGRVPDGLALRAAVDRAAPAMPPGIATTQAEDKTVAAALVEWAQWWADADGGADSAGAAAWNPARQEYTFAIAARTRGGAQTLTAAGYDGTRLDWDAFDVGGGDLGAGSDPAATIEVQSMVPVPVSYAGAPRRRWWEMEDSAIQFGSVEAGRDDLTRLLLMEFALVYGSDFFLVPLRLPVGSLTRIEELKVTDTFGGLWSIPSVGEVDGANREFSLFETAPADPSTPPPARPSLLLAPTLLPGLSGPAIEQVELVRDEMANVGWAVERTVPGADGRPLDRHEDFHRRAGEAAEAAPAPVGPDQGAPLRYRIATPPPEEWIPLVPVQVPTNDPTLQLRAMLDDAGSPLGPRGRMLALGMLVPDEEVPRDGRRLIRGWEHVRWIGGSSWLWCGRQAAVGRGEASSGLRFDIAEPE